MELKSLQDWTISKYIKAAPDVVDDSSFGGMTREYQVRVDPDKLVSYGLSLAQVEQQLSQQPMRTPAAALSNKARSRSTFAQWGWSRNVQDIEKIVIKTQKGTALRIKDIAVVTQGPKIRLGPNRKGHSSSGRRGGRR